MSETGKIENKIVGVISDTHNLLRPEALAALENSDLIIHAGDVCEPQILEQLKLIAPLVAVRGNNDRGAWARELNETETVTIGAVSIFVVHDLKDLRINPAAHDLRVVVSGHSHKPSITTRDGVLYLNPGSAGRRRFKLPVTVARLTLAGDGAAAEIITLAI